jgi:hypothetical protein
MSRIHVTIDHVVLHGAQPQERDAFVGGLRTELSRLLAEPGAASGVEGSRTTPVLRVPGAGLAEGASGHRGVGHGIARAIAKEVGR